MKIIYTKEIKRFYKDADCFISNTIYDGYKIFRVRWEDGTLDFVSEQEPDKELLWNYNTVPSAGERNAMRLFFQEAGI